jgi:hypothetical protein
MRSVLALTVAAAAVVAVHTPLGAQTALARYTALAVDMNTTRGSAATSVDITVTRWSTDAERDQLKTVLQEKGPDSLLDTLRAMPKAGSISTTGRVGFDLRYARRTPTPDGGERVVLITDRPINFREAWAAGRSLDYPFTLMELRLNAKGTGEGRLSLATKVTYDADMKTVTLENYTAQPVLLTTVTRVTDKKGK